MNRHVRRAAKAQGVHAKRTSPRRQALLVGGAVVPEHLRGALAHALLVIERAPFEAVDRHAAIVLVEPVEIAVALVSLERARSICAFYPGALAELEAPFSSGRVRVLFLEPSGASASVQVKTTALAPGGEA